MQPWLALFWGFVGGCGGVQEPGWWHRDDDGDGFGDPSTSVWSARGRHGLVRVGGDCDDTDPNVFPNATEIRSDGIDQDCDGVDATCDTHPDYPGMLRFERAGPPEGLDRYCAEFAGVDTVVIESTELRSLDVVRCFCRLGRLELRDNPQLGDLSVLEEILVTGELVVRDMPALETLAVRFDETGGIDVRGAPGLVSVKTTGLVEASTIWFGSLPALSTVELPELRSADQVVLSRLGAADLSWLSSLETVGRLRLSGLEQVTALAPLRNLTRIDQLEVVGTPIEDLARLPALEGFEELELTLGGDPSPAVEELAVLNRLGALRLEDATYRALPDLSALAALEGDLVVMGGELEALTGLRGLRTVGGDLWIIGNRHLVDVSALEGVRVGGSVVVLHNEQLAEADRQALLRAIAANGPP